MMMDMSLRTFSLSLIPQSGLGISARTIVNYYPHKFGLGILGTVIHIFLRLARPNYWLNIVPHNILSDYLHKYSITSYIWLRMTMSNFDDTKWNLGNLIHKFLLVRRCNKRQNICSHNCQWMGLHKVQGTMDTFPRTSLNKYPSNSYHNTAIHNIHLNSQRRWKMDITLRMFLYYYLQMYAMKQLGNFEKIMCAIIGKISRWACTYTCP